LGRASDKVILELQGQKNEIFDLLVFSPATLKREFDSPGSNSWNSHNSSKGNFISWIIQALGRTVYTSNTVWKENFFNDNYKLSKLLVEVL
jgi:hypothetical protein